jgi:GxxExxY protein
VTYDHIKIDLGVRADLVVDNKLIIELKSVETIVPVHEKQLSTYLKLANMKLGFLVNFNVDLIKTGIVRIANGL